MSSYVVLPVSLIRLMPIGLGFEAAASIPYSGISAWEILVEMGGLSPDNSSEGKKILVWGGSRPLERMVVQLAKRFGKNGITSA